MDGRKSRAQLLHRSADLVPVMGFDAHLSDHSKVGIVAVERYQVSSLKKKKEREN